MPLERIVSTALQIVDDEGADALSMRTLAQRLGSGTATLYRHFDNRAALVAHVVDRMFGAVELKGDELLAMGWQQALRTVAHTMFEALARHRNAARLMVEEIPLGPNAMALRENCVAALLDSGFPPRLAAHAFATLSRYVLGFAIQVNGHGGGGGQLDDAQVSSVFQSVDPALFPATVTVAGSMPVPIEDEFSFGLELLLSGLAHLRDDA
ncbi:TetR/AcrR family transcriptional regulator [Streptomyces cyaneochromogenes]|uniref:TetR/AcrR family transcriptional regulator n=1 Tax=Streptomyces cyaneochromogenes TaxID=2496836 RepID=A0A3Q9EWM0_9ACTN|nr:TetR/AcrR family transcriptional regulator [Streptomyces cyaneochromogenes]AZQ37125.1 TetR/AcrR family transcriptional regulator [Streptomyces cyaneochromogenes]